MDIYMEELGTPTLYLLQFCTIFYPINMACWMAIQPLKLMLFAQAITLCLKENLENLKVIKLLTRQGGKWNYRKVNNGGSNAYVYTDGRLTIAWWSLTLVCGREMEEVSGGKDGTCQSWFWPQSDSCCCWFNEMSSSCWWRYWIGLIRDLGYSVCSGGVDTAWRKWGSWEHLTTQQGQRNEQQWAMTGGQHMLRRYVRGGMHH